MLSPKSVSRYNALTYHQSEMKSYHDLATGEWYGKLKDTFNLGDLDYKSFELALDGINSKTGESLVSSKKKLKQARAAIDLTITGSKSFSILSSLADANKNFELKNALSEAFDKAINNTLDHVESNYASVRIQKNNVRKNVKTENLLFAKFHHETARPVTSETGEIMIDPNEHYHNLVMNYSKDENNNYRALEAKRIFKDKKKIGGFFSLELAQNLKELGIEIEITNQKYGFWQIKGFSEELIAEFSQRKKQINAKATELRLKFPNMNETKLLQKATLMSREKKQIIDFSREEIQAKYISRASKFVDVNTLLSDFSQKIQNSKEKQIEKVEDKKIIQAINKATQDVKLMPKYHQNKYSILNNSINNLLGQVRASLLFSRIEQKETTDKKELKTMHDVIVFQLEKSKLNTKKLFDFVNEIKEVSKIKLEEVLENGKNRRSDRDRLIKKFVGITNTVAKAKRTNDRDVGRDIAEAHRGGVDGTNSQRDDITQHRDDGTGSDKLSYRKALDIANKGGREQNENKQGVER